jgi:GNAT superfamily N-acetyltransferase
MAAVRAEPVRTRADRRAFVELPFRLYRDDPHWVPPLRRDVRELIDPARHPFHRHATVELFLARDGAGRVVGRVAAVHNERHLAIHGDGVGFFGLFESERDPAVAAALLDAAGAWLAARGLSAVRGPMSFSLNEECGLLVRGFDGPPRVMMPYNPPWYADLLEGWGLRRAKDLLAYWRGHGAVPERLARAADVLAERHRITVRPMNMRRFAEEVDRVRALYNAAWEANWGHVPMTEEELTYMAKQLRPVVDPDLVVFAEVRGEPAGFAIALPDLNVALARMNGRLLPFGWAKALWYGRRIDTLRVLTLGVLEPYRRTGAAELMYLHLLREAPRKGITKGEFSWVLEENTAMRAAIEKLGAEPYRTYRLYEAPLAAPAGRARA